MDISRSHTYVLHLYLDFITSSYNEEVRRLWTTGSPPAATDIIKVSLSEAFTLQLEVLICQYWVAVVILGSSPV